MRCDAVDVIKPLDCRVVYIPVSIGTKNAKIAQETPLVIVENKMTRFLRITVYTQHFAHCTNAQYLCLLIRIE